MKLLFLLLQFILAAGQSFGQDSSDYSFLEPVINKMHKLVLLKSSPNKIIYSDRFPHDSFFENRVASILKRKKISGITKETEANCLFLSKAEKRLVKDYIKSTESRKLPDNLFSNSECINSDTLNSIFKDDKRGWQYFREKYSASYFHILKPFFFRNNSLCLSYIIVITSLHDFEDRLIFYKKKNGKWEEWIVALEGIT
jgi:hypothetical protein